MAAVMRAATRVIVEDSEYFVGTKPRVLDDYEHIRGGLPEKGKKSALIERSQLLVEPREITSRPLWPMVLRIASHQLAPHLWIESLPESAKIGGRLH